MKQTKKYMVNLFRYPEQVEVEATSKSEAIKQAKNKVDFAVWKSEIEYEETTEEIQESQEFGKPDSETEEEHEYFKQHGEYPTTGKTTPSEAEQLLIKNLIKRDTKTKCHCGAKYDGSDHCPKCYAEQYEINSCECSCNRGVLK